MLNWEKQYDDNSNTEWYVASPFGEDDGFSYYWRLSQKLENDKILWYENHDLDIADDCPCDFETLEEAKQYIEERHSELINSAAGKCHD
jgi:hypothetical protein